MDLLATWYAQKAQNGTMSQVCVCWWRFWFQSSDPRLAGQSSFYVVYIVVWLFEAKVNSERGRIQKHGDGPMLCDVGSTTIPQQACAVSCTPHGSSSTSSPLTCVQVLQFVTGAAHAGFSVFATRKDTTF